MCITYIGLTDFLLFLFGFIYRWLFPFIGHMGICTSAGVIRDFAGPYFVSVRADNCVLIVGTCSGSNFNVL